MALTEHETRGQLIDRQLEHAGWRLDDRTQIRRYAIELSDTFLPAAFLEMFGDPVRNPKGFTTVPTGHLFDIQLGKMLDAKRSTGTHLRPYLGNANVHWGRFDLSDLKAMDFPDEDYERFRFVPGDIIVCEGGEVGRTAVWTGEISECCYQKALHRLRAAQRESLRQTEHLFQSLLSQAFTKVEI